MLSGDPIESATLPPDLRRFGLRLLAALRADDRVVGIWAIGSLARGEADPWSDLDLLVAIRNEAFATLVAEWQTFLHSLTPTVFAQRLGAADKPTITAITPEWCRFDLTLVSDADERPHSYVAKPLFSRAADTRASVFFTPTAQSDSDRLTTLVSHFLRVLGLLPVVIGRGELIVGLTPVALLRDALIELYLLENGASRGGAKRLNNLLTNEQRRALEALPPLAPTAEAIIANHRAIAGLFLPRARQLALTCGVVYPEQFERATLDHLASASVIDL